MRRILLGALALAGLVVASARAEAGAALDRIRATHVLVCGTPTTVDDYAKTWTHGNLQRLAADQCRALAIATLGPHGKARLIGYPERGQGLAALRAGRIQVLLGDTPDPADAALYRVAYGPSLFEDGQGFLVARSAGIRTLEDFAGRQVCFIAGTAAERRLVAAFQARGIDFLPFPFEEMGEMEAALVTGHCAAITADRSALAVMRTGFHARIGDFVILDQTISQEPLAPVYRRGDPAWAAIVDGTIRTLAEAEALGVTQANFDAMKQSDDPAVAALLRTRAAPAIAAVGNAGEIFARDLGEHSPLHLERQAELVPSDAAGSLPR
ncbi:MAG TPA: transporter substrate-binding domain-containing protein [Aliidongia sp.]|nr:transporter substrate-binding domain-containing protein [Aliidongia sp.]